MTDCGRAPEQGTPRLLTAARRLVTAVLGLPLVPTLAVGTAVAHGGGLGAAGRSTLRLPTWLVLVTGGAAVGASFLLSSFVTDRSLIRAIDGWRRRLPDPGRGGRALAIVLGLAGLLTVVGGGLAGPQTGANLAIMVVWVGWWAGFTMATYLVGNGWPAVNPWRHVAEALPSADRAYPERVGTWPAVAGLLGLVYLEVVSPLAADPSLLALVVLGYSLVTLAGAAAVGTTAWFRHADPISGVFRWYGRLAPVGRDRAGALELRVPSVALTRADTLGAPGDVALLVALVWVTTYDGLVATRGWADAVAPLVDAGLPAEVLYLLVLLGGFALFLAAFAAAARASRALAGTYLSRATLLALVAPSLVAIAAGYHLAHYLGYFLTYLPALAAVARAPLNATTVAALPVLSLPGWFEVVGMGAVLLGHLLAIWIAHSRAFAAIPDRMAAIRSQAPFVAVMVAYTMTSLWIVAQPEVPVPYT